MGVERGVGEALPLVLSEELAVAQSYVVDLVARATAVHPLPGFWRLVALSGKTTQPIRSRLLVCVLNILESLRMDALVYYSK